MRNPPSSSPASASTPESGAKTTPCCSKVGLKRGPWTPEEDELLANYINKEGEGRWRTLPKRAGLLRCGKSCRLRWMNYLRPSVKRGHIAADEEDLILRLHRLLGNRWSLIAGRIPGRTDNEIKNYWNTHLSKKLISQGIDPRTHRPLTDVQINQKDVSKLQSPDPNATHNSDGAADGQPEDFHINPNTIPAEFPFDPTKNGTNHHQTVNANANGLVLPCNNSIINGESPGSFDDQEQEDPKYCNEDVFSSFLNSLINEDMFTSQNQQQLPRYDALNPSVFGFGAPANWEASPNSAAGFHDDQPQ